MAALKMKLMAENSVKEKKSFKKISKNFKK
jgi:hypothetical protein